MPFSSSHFLVCCFYVRLLLLLLLLLPLFSLLPSPFSLLPSPWLFWIKVNLSWCSSCETALLSDSPPLSPCSECGREPSLSSSTSLLQREADLSEQLDKFFSDLFSLLLPFLPSCPFTLLLWLTLFNIRLIHILEMEVPVDITR